MVVPDEAAALVQVSPRAIYRLIEAEEIHFLEAPQVFVCLDSVRDFFTSQTAIDKK